MYPFLYALGQFLTIAALSWSASRGILTLSPLSWALTWGLATLLLPPLLNRWGKAPLFIVAGTLCLIWGSSWVLLGSESAHWGALIVLSLGGATVCLTSGAEIATDNWQGTLGWGYFLAAYPLGLALGQLLAYFYPNPGWGPVWGATAALLWWGYAFYRSPRHFNSALLHFQPLPWQGSHSRPLLFLGASALLGAVLSWQIFQLLPLPFQGGALLLTAAALAAGGWSTRRWGVMKSATFSLLLALGALLAPLWAPDGQAWLYTLGLASLNFSLPLLGWSTNRLLPTPGAWSWSLLSAAYLLGALPLYLRAAPLAPSPLHLSALALLALCLLYPALRWTYSILQPVDQTPPQNLRTERLENHTLLVP